MQIPIFRGGGCVKLIDVCNPKQWKTISASELVEDGYPVFGANGIIGYFSDYNHEKPTLCITCRGATCGTVNKSLPYSYITGNSMALDDLDESVITIDFLYYFLQYRGFDDVITGSAQPQITRQSLSKIFIPEIDLNIQKNITQIIKSLEQLILNRDKQRENFNMLVKSRYNELFGDLFLNEFKWDYASFNEFAKFDTKMISDFTNFIDLPHIGIDSIEKNTGKLIGYRTVGEDQISSGKYLFTKKHIIYSKIRPNLNKVALPDFMGVCSADAYPILTVEEKMNRIFLAHVLRSDYFLNFILSFSSRTNLPKVNKSQISKFKCPLPPLSLQNEFADFVAQVDKSQFACQMAIKLWRNSLKSSII